MLDIDNEKKDQKRGEIVNKIFQVVFILLMTFASFFAVFVYGWSSLQRIIRTHANFNLYVAGVLVTLIALFGLLVFLLWCLHLIDNTVDSGKIGLWGWWTEYLAAIGFHGSASFIEKVATWIDESASPSTKRTFIDQAQADLVKYVGLMLWYLVTNLVIVFLPKSVFRLPCLIILLIFVVVCAQYPYRHQSRRIMNRCLGDALFGWMVFDIYLQRMNGIMEFNTDTHYLIVLCSVVLMIWVLTSRIGALVRADFSGDAHRKIDALGFVVYGLVGFFMISSMNGISMIVCDSLSGDTWAIIQTSKKFDTDHYKQYSDAEKQNMIVNKIISKKLPGYKIMYQNNDPVYLVIATQEYFYGKSTGFSNIELGDFDKISGDYWLQTSMYLKVLGAVFIWIYLLGFVGIFVEKVFH